MGADKHLKDLGFIIFFLLLVVVFYMSAGSRPTFYFLLVIFASMFLTNWDKISQKIKEVVV